MTRLPPRTTRTDTPCPYTTLFRSPHVPVAADLLSHAPAQVVAQHAGAVRGVDVPRAAAAAVADRLRAFAPGLRVEPARVRLPQLRGIEQNRADTVSTAAGAERRQAFGSIARGHPARLTSAWLTIPLFPPPPDRQRGLQGKRGSVRVSTGVRR